MGDIAEPIVGDSRHEPSQAIFHQAWRIYRTMVEENYLFHREASACLRQVLLTEARQPFRFLDIACGDASASLTALKGTPIAAYHGIDLSKPALELAREALMELDCPVTLEQADFVTALRERREPVDVAWVGVSLHHFQTPEKLAVMRDIRRILSEEGLLLIYENASPDGEDRAGWLRRWDRQEVHVYRVLGRGLAGDAGACSCRRFSRDIVALARARP